MTETIDKMTVPHLRDMAKELGVVGASGMKKEQLIHEIVARKPELAPPEKGAHHKVVIGKRSRDFVVLKAQRAGLKKEIAAAVEKKDGKLAKELRKSKKHARRLLKKARVAGLLKPPAPAEKEEKKEG